MQRVFETGSDFELQFSKFLFPSFHSNSISAPVETEI